MRRTCTVSQHFIPWQLQIATHVLENCRVISTSKSYASSGLSILVSPSYNLYNCSAYHMQHMTARFNPLRPRRNRRYNADDIFKCICLKENVWGPTKISLKFVPKGPINNIPALVQIMAWRRPGDKPLFKPMMDSLPTHICVTRPQWVKWYYSSFVT